MQQELMSWSQLLNSKRLKDRPSKTDTGRTGFNSDHDKIIFSGAFRRLAKKTQVHPLATNDHVHNRLTHSLEVACVGRTLGIRVGEMLLKLEMLPKDTIQPSDIGDIVEAICLAHDIGNPPFGHSGEEAIRAWFKGPGAPFISSLELDQQTDLKTYEGNAQGFRILTTCEGYSYEHGMRLTYATLASFVKYPWSSVDSQSKKKYTKENKYGIFTSEKELFEDVAKNTGLIELGAGIYCRHPLVYLMEAADDFCYAIIDLEDGIAMGILSWNDVYSILKTVVSQEDLTDFEKNTETMSNGRRMAILRGLVIQSFVDAGAKAFIDNHEKFLSGQIFKDKSDLIKLCRPEVSKAVSEAKKLAAKRIFKHPRKIELEIGAYNILSTLLSNFVGAVTEFVECQCKVKNVSSKSARVLDLIGIETFSPLVKAYATGAESDVKAVKYDVIMRGLDFICGMTDHYATYLAQQFNGMGKVG